MSTSDHPILSDTIPLAMQLGESVIWDYRNRAAWWTDIRGSEIFRLVNASAELQRFPVSAPVTAIALTADPDRLLCATTNQIVLLRADNGTIENIVASPDLLPGTRLNDGKVSPRGDFWVGSMVETGAPGRGSLYRITASGALDIRRMGIDIANGLAWNADGSQMYFADSPTARIERCRPAEREPESFEDFFDIEGRGNGPGSPGGVPDGAAVDEEGCLWSAIWGAGRVIRISPEGQLLLSLKVPCPQPTCVAFGGPELDQLYVTSAREGLSDQTLARFPDSGSVFVFATDVVGLREPVWGVTGR